MRSKNSISVSDPKIYHPVLFCLSGILSLWFKFLFPITTKIKYHPRLYSQSCWHLLSHPFHTLSWGHNEVLPLATEERGVPQKKKTSLAPVQAEQNQSLHHSLSRVFFSREDAYAGASETTQGSVAQTGLQMVRFHIFPSGRNLSKGGACGLPISFLISLSLQCPPLYSAPIMNLTKTNNLWEREIPWWGKQKNNLRMHPPQRLRPEISNVERGTRDQPLLCFVFLCSVLLSFLFSVSLATLPNNPPLRIRNHN